MTGILFAAADGLLQAQAAFPVEGLGQSALVAGIASTWMVAQAKVGELFGNTENVSLLPQERKLPYDSDVKVGGILLAIGAVVGLAIGWAVHENQADPAEYWILPLLAGGLIGIAVPWPIVRQLGKEYLDRARWNCEQGNFTEAMQDAAEVERISEVYKAEAIALKDYARQMRGEGVGLKLSAAGNPTASEEADAEFAEFLSNYKPGSL